MASGGSIKYSIGFNVDKTGLNQLKSSLQEIKNMTGDDLVKISGKSFQDAQQDLKDIQGTLKQVEAAFDSAFNADLGTLNIAKFNQTLSSSGLTIQKIQADLAKAGTAGQNAFRNMTSQILTTNMKLKESHTLIDSMATTMANTIKWGAASSVMNTFTGTVQKAYGYVKNLDSSLNDIRIVTGKSADEMDRFAEKANKAAKNLGQTTTNYTDAALIYYQQGLSDAEVQARAEVTLKAANVTGQSGAEVSEQLTAVWNGYKVTAAEAELYIDKLAAVAATTASDLEELSTGMSKVASAANLMGVDVDQLNAQLATIVSVTRQAPESVGTALKTIYARMGDIEAGLDSETTLGDYTKKMAAMGVNVLDMNGQLRDMGEVMEEIGGKWTSMSREQQVYLSQVMAGTRQYNNLLSLFDNWDQYTKSLETSANAAGTLQEQQDIYMESTKAHLAQLKASWEDLYDSLLDEKAINGVADGLSGVVSLMANFVDSIGGGSGLLLALGAIGTKVFSKQIAGGLMTLINNLNVASDNMMQLQAEMQLTSQLGILPNLDSRTQQLVQMKKEFLELGQNVTNEERELSNELIKQTNELFKQEDLLNKRKENVQDIYNRFTGGNINPDKATTNEKETAKASLEVQKDEFSRASSDLGEMEKAVDINKQQVVLKRQLKDLEVQIASAEEDRKKDLEEQEAILKKQIKSLDEQNAKLQNAEGFIEQMSQYRDLGMFTSEQSNLLDETINKFHQITDGIDETSPKFQTAVKNLAQIFKQILGGAIDDIDIAIDGISEGFNREAEQIKNNQTQVKAAFEELKNSIDLRNAIQGTVQFIGALGQLASTINNLRQIGNIWSNDDLSAGEKILQTVQNLGFTIPMLVTAIATLKNSYGDLAKSMSGVLLSVKKYIFALGQETNSTITNTIAKSGGTAANLTFAQSFKVLFTSMGPVGWAIMGITAAITILVPLISKFISAQNTASEVLERAEKNVSVLTDRYKELSTEVDNFKSKVSSYDEAITALKDLEKGTDEYKQKLEETNKVAKELIETYGLFDDYKFENGLLTIDSQALADAQAEKETQKKQAEINLNYAKIGENNALIGKKIDDLANKLPSIQEYGAEISPGYPEEGRYENTRYLNEDEIKSVASAYHEAYQENGNVNDSKLLGQVLQDIFPDYSGISDFAKDEWGQKYFLELGESMHSVADANEYYAKMATAGAVEVQHASEIKAAALTKDKETGEEILYAGREDALLNAITNQIAQGISLENYDIQSITSNNKLNEKFGYQIGSDEDLFKEYAKKFLAYTDAEISRMSYANGTLSLDGNEVLNNEEISAEGARQALAQIAAVQQEVDKVSEESRNKIISDFDLIAQRTDELADGAGTSITNAILNSMDYSGDGLDLSSAWETMSPWENQALLKEANSHSPEELADLMGLGPEEFEAMGYANAKEFAGAFRKELAEYNEEAFEQNEINAINRDAEAEGFKTEEVDAYAESLKETAEASELLSDDLKDNDIAAQQVAKQIMKLNRGVEELGSNWENWSDILKNSDAGSQEYSQALDGVKNSLADIADTSAEYITNDFVQEHLKEIGEAAEGDAEAIDNLRMLLSEEIVAKISIDNELSPDKVAEFTDSWNILAAQMQDIEVGVMLSGEDALITALNEMILVAGMTTTQVNDLLGSMGFSATFAKEPQEVTTTIPEYTTYHVPQPNGTSFTTYDQAGNATVHEGWSEVSWTEQTGEHVASGEAMAFAMSTDGSVPKIESITRSSSGSTGNYSSSNSGGAKSPGSSKKSSGGGSKSKPKEPSKMDPLKEERDRYHDINNELKKLNTQLERQERITSKLTGRDRINALNQQIALLDKQNERQKEKLNLLQQEQSELQSKLGSQGVKFDDDGSVSNYNEILQQKQDYINGLISQYNNMSAEEQEKFKETIDKAKEEYEQFKDDLERYEDIILDEIPEIQEEVEKALDRKIEMQIEKMEIEIKLKIDLQEAKRELEDFLSDIFTDEDDYIGIQEHAMNNIPTYLEKGGTVETYQNAWNRALQAYETIKAGGTDEIYGDDAAKAWEDVIKYQGLTMDAIRSAKEEIEKVEQAYLDGIDAANEAFDEHLEKYADINDQLEHYLRVTELLKGEDAYDEQIAYYEQMEQNNLARMEFLRDEVAFWEEQMAKEEEGSDAWKKAQENAVAAQKELNSLIEESIEVAQKKYEATVKSVMKSITDAATDGMGLDYVKEQWELINKEADMYLDKINGAYEIEKLESKMLKALDNTTSVKSRERINDLMNDELGKLREKDKLSQYEVDRANALFDLELKKIALEEAQRNKSTMRLRRDSQGNYSYQYVSDNDAIADAKAEVDEAQNALYNLDLEAYKDNLDKSLELFDEWQSKRQEIMIKYAGDEEKMKEHLALIDKEYEDMITFNTEQNELIRQNLQQSTFESLAAMRDLDVEDFNNMTLEEQDIIMNSMVPFWNSGVQSMTDKFTGKDDSFVEVCKEGFAKLDEATQAYKTSLDAIGEAAGVDLGAISSGQQTVLGEIQQLQGENDTLLDKYDATLGKLRDNVEVTKEWVTQLQNVAREAENAMNKVIALQEKEANGGGSGGGSGSGGSSGGSGSGGSGGGSGSGSSGGGSSSSGGSGGGSSSSGGGTTSSSGGAVADKWAGYGYKVKDNGKTADIRNVWTDNGKLTGYKKRLYSSATVATLSMIDLPHHGVYKNAIALRTGGYTGTWADGDRKGKLAVLHQKEIVLNKTDTARVLEAVQMARAFNEDLLNANDYYRLAQDRAEMEARLIGESFADYLEQVNALQSSEMSAALDSSSIAKSIEELVEMRAISSVGDISSIREMNKLFEGRVGELLGEVTDSTQGQIEQNVYIDANFPGVSVEGEIIAAFDTLFTKATQQMYSTKK